MSTGPESRRHQEREFPDWVPDAVVPTLNWARGKEPLDLTDPDIAARHLASEYEIEDIQHVLGDVQNPVFIGIGGSRSHLDRPPLFRSVEEYDRYYTMIARGEGGLELYLEQNLPHADLMPDPKRFVGEARDLLGSGNFNARYKEGEIFAAPHVNLLVSDIDLIVIGKNVPKLTRYNGRRTRVPIDIVGYSPTRPFPTDQTELNAFLVQGLRPSFPLRLPSTPPRG